MINNTTLLNSMNAPVRNVKAKVELYEGSTLVNTFNYNDNLISLSIERAGDENKFFGFGLCQKMNVHLRDVNREINISTENSLKIYMTSAADYEAIGAVFYVTEVNRDETTNELSITAYDALESASGHTVAELDLIAPYTIEDVVSYAASKIGVRYEKDLIPNIEEWNLENGAYLEDGYIVLPEANSLASVRVPWNKRSQAYTFKMQADSDEENYSVQTSISYFDDEGYYISGNGNHQENLNGASKFVYQRTADGSEYAEAIGNAASIVVDVRRSADYAPKAYKFKNVLFYVTDEETAFDLNFPDGANFEGTETIRETLNAAAEATQTIYYIDTENVLLFKQLDVNGDAVYTIDKSKYFELQSRLNRRLSAICHVTDLGDNVIAESTLTGTTQYVRNNPFWDLRDDIDVLVDGAFAAVGEMTINQFDCSWRGNFLLEIGDKIALVNKDNEIALSYVLNDTISYDGTLSQTTKWEYSENESETAANSSTLGESLRQTFARVDKANKNITILASDITADRENLATLEVTTESLTGKVSSIEEATTGALESLNEDVATLTQAVETKMTDEDVTIKISEALSNGVDKVETSTGFVFNEVGLTVSKSDSEMTTSITEDGMRVFKDAELMLTANNDGVSARNLHATTYLIIGENSRFEDFGDRTGCFWIGG